ncbi:tRNA (adenosine(37)-N6)-threonylcarbamoyltransferase complex dimerization subunit type 1 TsaB [filamentous cyanobacterium LEGE 11480]|uniref:tRNA (Adenosine(37)-N6)-threonylcarbamoyltransferase complex dimerization subunit type 1 TsaB n=1 Tax=Romeriopsis navalis LEGE 11480 TaxID=2777977 RepID=A0A928VP39_9CYAN|nr:tRNA (adenosine(37)-N6)-threonylcarbamoyltransferase complex dimerization subunit type 1 TsaB [Romeriopsis navalis]MBE9029962.1 tRNA (adenosine(37)-N6)-threonylcarbamoyltransferase complex dimerization subunit type 1 TsaB [Romeriopsis navalis LEGE 11480]
MTYGLAIHTSSPELGFALDNFHGDQRAAAWNLGRESSTQMHDRLASFLPPQMWTDLAFVTVAIGPGGFTGTRLGVVLGRTLAQQLNIPLFGISSLMAIADAQMAELDQIAIDMPAQRGAIYAAIYCRQAPAQYHSIFPDQVLQPDDWAQQLAQRAPLPKITAIAEQGRYAPNLLAIAHAQWQAGHQPNWSTVLPYYGQHPVVQN